MKNTIILSLTVLLLAACGSAESTNETVEVDELAIAAESFERIESMLDSVYNAKPFSPRGVRAVYDVCNAHIAKFPNDSVTPHVLFRAATIGQNLNFDERSIRQFDRIITDFPNWYKASDAAYLKAFTLDEIPGREEEAKKAYEEVIAKYPQNKFAEDAKKMLENVYLSDEELIKKFEEMNKTNNPS